MSPHCNFDESLKQSNKKPCIETVYLRSCLIFSYNSELCPMKYSSPILIAGALRFPLGPMEAAITSSLFSGLNSRFFLPLAAFITDAFRRISQACSASIFSFPASTVFSISIPARSAWAFWQVFHPFLRYAQSIFFMVNPPHSLFLCRTSFRRSYSIKDPFNILN